MMGGEGVKAEGEWEWEGAVLLGGDVWVGGRVGAGWEGEGL